MRIDDFIYTIWIFAIGFCVGALFIGWSERATRQKRAREQFIDQVERMELLVEELRKPAVLMRGPNGAVTIKLADGLVDVTIPKRQLARLL